MNSKWSCCDHRSKHSKGCTPSFCGTHHGGPSSNNSNISQNKPSANIARGPLPPTPADSVVPTPPPHSSHYHQSHAHIPDTVQSYEHHDLNSPKEKSKKGGGGGGRGAVGLASDHPAELIPPPVPVSCVVAVVEVMVVGASGRVMVVVAV